MTISLTGSATFSDTFIQTSDGVQPDGTTLNAGPAGALSINADGSLTMTNTFIDTSTVSATGNSGPVTLTTNGLLSLTDSFIFTVSSGSGNGGAVTIAGKDVTLIRDGVQTDVDTGVFNLTTTPAAGQVHPGAVTVTAENTVTFSGSFSGDPGIPVISTVAFGTLVDAGQVMITGKTVNLSDGLIDLSIHNRDIVSPGSGGAIEIRGNNVNLTQFQLISLADGLPESTGTGGSILLRGADSIHADNIQLTASQVNSSATTGGGGGNIEFQSKVLTVSDHTDVATGSFGQGSGGTITVRGAEDVTIESGSRMITDVIVSLVGVPQGTAGNILVETQNLTLLTGGIIRAGARPNSTGNSGNITVQGNSNNPAQSILIDGAGSGIFSTAEGTGAGGNIFMNANSVAMTNDSNVSASSTGPGNAGNIQIDAGNQFAMTNSTVTTEADQAGGGNIKITTDPSGTVQLTNSTISASVADGPGGGGNISIDPQYVILQNSQILAQAAQGQGGAITIIITNGGLYLPDANSFVNADSGSGVNGTVTIQSPNAPASGQIQPLSKTPLQATSLLNQHCASLADGEFSSFTVAGRDSLPTEPGNWLASPLATLNAGMGLGTKTDGVRPVGQSEGREGDIQILSLRQIAPAGFLTQAFAVDWSASCQS